MKHRLPIGIQGFAKIREEGFLYVDKTARIHELLTGSGGPFSCPGQAVWEVAPLFNPGAVFEGRIRVNFDQVRREIFPVLFS
jgi:hypothetical protein